MRVRKVKLYPSAEQCQALDRWQGKLRRIWNAANEQYHHVTKIRRQHEALGEEKISYPSAYGQGRELTELRRDPYWSEVPQAAQAETLRDLEKAWRKRWKSGVGKPRYKRRGDSIGITLPRVRVVGRAFRLPKMGFVKFRGAYIESPKARISIVKEPDGWFASILCPENQAAKEHAPTGTTIGVDVGVSSALALSDGRQIPNPRFKDKEAARLRRLERGIARQRDAQAKRRAADTRAGAEGPRYESKRLAKRQNRKARLERKIARRRHSWQHAITTQIAREVETVFLEDLNVARMTKSARGSGSGVAAKAGLNRAILDVGWYGIKTKLEYKTAERGGSVVTVNAKHTSQRCSSCGHVDAESRDAKAFACTSCGHKDDADVNAAKNILARGLGEWRSAPCAH